MTNGKLGSVDADPSAEGTTAATAGRPGDGDRFGIVSPDQVKSVDKRRRPMAGYRREIARSQYRGNLKRMRPPLSTALAAARSADV